MNVRWNNISMRSVGPLYQAYDNLADVTTDEGEYAGKVLLLNGHYRASTRSQVMMGWFDTESEALDAIARGNRGEYGS